MPLWLMRQAGRYLPEYRTLRAKAENFLKLCLTPDWAAEITLQPLRRFDFDAAIVFADILLVPLALGANLNFQEGEGPLLEKVENTADLDRLVYDDRKIGAVYETLGIVKPELSLHTTLIGFCGAPWTVACYMIDGSSRDLFQKAKAWSKERPKELQRLIDIVSEASVAYLSGQVKAGAEAVQVFDSWAGLLEGEDFIRWVVEPTRRLVAMFKALHPDVPVIGFPRGAGSRYAAYAQMTGIDALSIDQSVPVAAARKDLQRRVPLQGNLDPGLLVEGGEAMIRAARTIMDKLGPRHVMNLGHGVLPQTPLDNVYRLVECVREYGAGR